MPLLGGGGGGGGGGGAIQEGSDAPLAFDPNCAVICTYVCAHNRNKLCFVSCMR